MNLIKSQKNYHNSLIRILNDLNIKKLNNKDINFFKKKKILITGVSGLIGIKLLFFLNKLIKENFISISQSDKSNAKKYFRTFCGDHLFYLKGSFQA